MVAGSRGGGFVMRVFGMVVKLMCLFFEISKKCVFCVLFEVKCVFTAFNIYFFSHI